jgi:hypothetical protein
MTVVVPGTCLENRGPSLCGRGSIPHSSAKIYALIVQW